MRLPVLVGPRRRPSLITALSAALLTATACTGAPQQATPTKLGPKRTLAGQDEGEHPELYRDPRHEAPNERFGEQLAPEALEATLARAQELIAKGDNDNAIRELQTCANKLQPSPRCEGELGMLLAPSKRRKADALYYLKEAVNEVDPKADVDFYRRLGQALRSKGQSTDAARSYGYVLTLEPDKAENYADFATALQGVPERIEEAADALAKARELQPQDQWLYDEGLLRGQIAGQAGRAAELLQTYIDHTRGQDPERDELLLGRITEFRSLAKVENSAKPESTTPDGKASAPKGTPIQ